MGAEEEAKVWLTLQGRDFERGLKDSERAMENFDRKVGTGFDKTTKSVSALSEVQHLGARRMTRYAQAAATLSRPLDDMGVKGRALGTSFTILNDVISGGFGPAGAAIIAVGALASAIGYVVREQKELKEATDAATQALLDQVAKTGIYSTLASFMLTEKERGLLDEQAEKMARLVELEDALARGVMKYKTSGWEVALQGDAAATADLMRESSDLQVRLEQITELMDKIRQARAGGTGGFVGPPESAMIPSNIPDVRPGVDALTGPQPFAGPPGILQFLRIGDEWERLAEQMQVPADEIQEMIKQVTRDQEDAADAAERMSARFSNAYRALGTTAVGTQTAIATVTEKLLTRENWSRLKGLQVAKYVAAETAAAGLQGLAEYAKGELAIAIATLAKYVANPLYSGLIPGQLLAVGKWALAAGVASGAAAAISAGARKEFDKGPGGIAGDLAGGGGSFGGESSRQPGARLVDAGGGGAPQFANFTLSITYAGTTIYGEDGMREAFYQDILPLIEEAFGTRLLRPA